MDDLPELPFEQVLSYLNLEDRLKARAVSRAWRNKFDRYPPKTLCYSSRKRDFILGKNRWISGTFAENFISSTRFASFFDTFGPTILSSLKHLRFCGLDLDEGDRTIFARILNSFGQLEELDIIWSKFNQRDVLNLNLPMLTSLQLERVHGFWKLTLEAPRLREVKVLYCSVLSLEIVHGESVERLLCNCWDYTEMKKLKSLKALYIRRGLIDSTFLSNLQHLKEFHTNDSEMVSELFEQKQRSGRVDLKIYLWGLLLNSADDPAINALRDSSDYLCRERLVCLAENRSRLADQIPFYSSLHYPEIEGVAPGLEVDLLKRCTRLDEVTAYRPVQNIQRFLDLLENYKNIVVFEFDGNQPQDLFDRLPERFAIQSLTFYSPPSDLAFLFRLKHLTHLYIYFSIDKDTVRRAFDELPVLSSFSFRIVTRFLQDVSMEIVGSNQFRVSADFMKTFSDLNAAIESIFENRP